MRSPGHPRRTPIVAALAVMFVLVPAFTALAADPPVRATVAVTGTPIPGNTVSATATLTITDGSTLQSVAWKQVRGVPVTIAGGGTATVSITLPDRGAFKHELVEILGHAPIPAAQFPSYVPEPAHYAAGLQDRFSVVGIAPHALEDAAAIGFELTVVTTSGTWNIPASLSATLPWPHATGLRNVPIATPVLLHGKKQASYDWTLTRPAGSTATLVDATSANPELVPDVAGTYELRVTDLATGTPVILSVHAGTWRGMVRAQDAAGRPLADYECTTCHVKTGPLDMFTPWAKSGHAEVFTQNVNAPNGHYTKDCLSCHVVGYDLGAVNGGIDEMPGFEQFAASGLLTHGDPMNWSKILSDYPAVAKMANIQCENCHGPQTSPAHMKGDGARVSLSSDLCGTCHGEPARHGRYQQWQLSRHGNYELAATEGTNPSCSKCHSAQGFIAWQKAGFGAANVQVTWTAEEAHPATCVACHDPHDVGTTSGGPTTNAKVRVSGTTPMLTSGFAASDVGNAALCMTCHNGRRGLRNDSNFTLADASRAPHLGPQADVLMGENMYFAAVGKRGYHSMVEDSCVTCHMESTPPPAALSHQGGGTNHSFFASKDICVKCHSNITAESVQGPIEAKMEALKHEIEKAILLSMQNQLRLGNSIDIGGQKTIRSATDLAGVELIESHGRQGVSVVLTDRSEIHDIALNAVKVIRPGGSSAELYAVTDPSVAKAGWNYFVAHADKSKGVHNPTFVSSALDVALFATRQSNATATNPQTTVPASLGGGVGNYQGAVGCTSPYVYWTEIAGHIPGNAGSQWRTDLVTRNLGSSTASLKFILHVAGGNTEGAATVAGSSQRGFEDIVGILGAQGKVGSLEICSDQPLLVTGRIFNQGPDGTFGQNLDGHVADLGYGAGQTVSLIGLRQKSGVWRTNLSVTNGGTIDAEVLITLFDAAGSSLMSYNLPVPAGMVVQEVEPFLNRANRPDLDWGFATVTVLRGRNIRTMGALIDMGTNDPTTIPAKQ